MTKPQNTHKFGISPVLATNTDFFDSGIFVGLFETIWVCLQLMTWKFSIK